MSTLDDSRVKVRGHYFTGREALITVAERQSTIDDITAGEDPTGLEAVEYRLEVSMNGGQLS